jgi:Arc/MetJ-type ribon-helix-helix transcriptional regulator
LITFGRQILFAAEVTMTEESTKKNDETGSNPADSGSGEKSVLEELGDQVEKFATRTVESIKKTIERARLSRNTVLTIRVNDDANKKLTALVESGLFKSRSESAAFLIQEGIKHQEMLFDKIAKKMIKIEKLKQELSEIISSEISEKKRTGKS